MNSDAKEAIKADRAAVAELRETIMRPTTALSTMDQAHALLMLVNAGETLDRREREAGD